MLGALEAARNHFNAPILINSAARCAVHNSLVHGGRAGQLSQHLLGKAADIVVGGVQPEAVFEYFDARYSGRFGIGRYRDFTHLDVRRRAARWEGA